MLQTYTFTSLIVFTINNIAQQLTFIITIMIIIIYKLITQVYKMVVWGDRSLTVKKQYDGFLTTTTTNPLVDCFVPES